MTLVKFRIRRDSVANWTAANPTLALGEPAFETDSLRVKYGDGITAWNDLPYSSEPFSGLKTITGRTIMQNNVAFESSFEVYNTNSNGVGAYFQGGGLNAMLRVADYTGSIKFTVGPNGILNVSNAPTYVDDAAAGAGGLTSGDVYKTTDGAGGFFLKIKS